MSKLKLYITRQNGVVYPESMGVVKTLYPDDAYVYHSEFIKGYTVITTRYGKSVALIYEEDEVDKKEDEK